MKDTNSVKQYAIERIVYHKERKLPDSFWQIPIAIYEGLEFSPAENQSQINALFELKVETHAIIIYTDHKSLRLVGIFSRAGGDCHFGFWETIDDVHLNREGFKLLYKDAIELDKAVLTGPMNFNTFHNYRLRIGATPSWQMFHREPINPEYYSDLLEGLDFVCIHTYESRRIHKPAIHKFYEFKGELTRQIKDVPFEIIALNSKSWMLYEDAIFELISLIFSQNVAYKSISKVEFQLLYNETFAESLCPHTSSLFKDKTTGQLIGIMMCLPDYASKENPQKNHYNFNTDYPKLHKPTLLAKSAGVHPDYRNNNLMNFSGAYTMLSFRELYEDVIFCTMKSDNYSIHFTDGIDCEKAHYALYEKQLANL